MSKVNNIIKSYKQRLVQIDSRNASYFLSVLKDRRAIDLVDVWREFGICDLYKCLAEYGEIELKPKRIDHIKLAKILRDRKADYRDQIRALIPSFSRTDFERFEAYVDRSGSSYRVKALIDNLLEKYDKLYNGKFQAFRKLRNSAKTVIRDFGKDDLYLGYPFIEGKFSSGNVFRAPLVLHRITIKDSGSGIKIKMAKGESILNPVFLTAYLFETNLAHQKLEWEIEDNDYLAYALKVIKQDMNVNVISQDKILYPIMNITKKQYREKNTMARNTFAIKYYSVIGLFPLSNRNIFNDLEELETATFANDDSLSSFVLGDTKFSIDDLYGNKQIERPSEFFMKYVTPLDYSQKQVVSMALDNNLVIQGPPGTGKSQTIVNIIINAIQNDKRVLVVSEKVAAINVIYNRLGLLQENTLLIKNHITDKDNFYDQLGNTIDSLQTTGSIEYSEYNDLVIDKHLEYIHKMNSSEAYKGFSFKEIAYLNTLNINHKLEKKIKKYAKRHIELDCINNKTKLDSFIMGLLSKKAYTEYEQYLVQKALKSYKKASVEALKYLVANIAKKTQYEVILYNTYLLEKYKGVIPYTKFKKYDFDVKITKEENLELEVNNIWNRKEIAFSYLEESDKFVYDIILKYPGVEQVIIKWKKLGETGQKEAIKRFFNPRFRLADEIVFNDNELEVYDHLVKYHSGFDIQMVKRGMGINVSLYKAIKEEKIKNKNQLAMFLLQSGYCKFDNKSFNDLISIIKNDMDTINVNRYIKGMHISKKEGKLIKKISENTEKEKIRLIIEKEFVAGGNNIGIKISKYFNDYQAHYKEVNISIESKIANSFKYIYGHIKSKIKERMGLEYENIMQLRDLKQQVGLKRRKGIKTIALRYFDLLYTLYPVMLMTPESASAFLPLKKGLFDLVIFDEASQMFVERAVPSIYRANNIIVAGDSQQLKPTSVFTTRFVEDEEIDEDLEIDNATFNALTSESLLDHACGKFKSSMLLYHYRSEHKELIDFSSSAFYGGKLLFASSANSEIEKPITIIHVKNGRWIKRRNEIEALELVNLIKYILKTRNNNESIGIVTFNISQKEYIEDLLLNEKSNDIKKELNRINTDTNEDESLFVKNIENVQGDERDIIVFSIGYAPNEKGKVINQFGSLNQAYGENRLNVAITRAKQRIYIVKSIMARELKVNENNRGPHFFKKYLEYAEMVNDNIDVTALLDTIGDIKKKTIKAKTFDSIETEIYEAVTKKIGSLFEVHKKIRVGSFYIDLGIYSKEYKRYIVAIECDGVDNALDVIERDYYRQVYLENRGWNVIRLWSVNWWADQNKEIKNIMNAINIEMKNIKPHDDPADDDYKPVIEDEKVDFSDDTITCICKNVFNEKQGSCPKCKRSVDSIIKEKENRRTKTSLL